jgi:Flp pilus assembly protein TadG
MIRLILALRHNRAGNASVELAFIVPSMILFVIGIIEVGRVMWLQNALNYSVVEAARCLSNNPDQCSSASATQTFAANQAGAGFDSSVFTVTTASCGNKVTGSYPVTLTIPYMTLSATLTSQACYPT